MRRSMSALAKTVLKDDGHVVRRVAIVGGTHGNERNGIFAARHLLKDTERASRSTFETTVDLANPAAIAVNRRYVDEDMNRCFSREMLSRKANTREARRAEVLDQVLGPKSNDERRMDLVIDLHNTTSDCGYALMMRRDDALSHALCATLQKQYSDIRCCEWDDKPDHATLPSCGRSGFTLEVGPVPQGVADAVTYQKTLELIDSILDAVEARNQALLSQKSSATVEPLQVYRRVDHVDFPRDDDHVVAGLIAPEVRDFVPLEPGQPLLLGLGGECVKNHGDSNLTPFFVNEAAYYEKGVAFVLAEVAEVGVEVVS